MGKGLPIALFIYDLVVSSQPQFAVAMRLAPLPPLSSILLSKLNTRETVGESVL